MPPPASGASARLRALQAAQDDSDSDDDVRAAPLVRAPQAHETRAAHTSCAAHNAQLACAPDAANSARVQSSACAV
jgi:hypothetical protein